MKAFQIKKFPDYYITDIGDVYSKNYKQTGRIKKLKPKLNKKGYFRVSLRTNNKSYQKYIHRLVAESFIINRENKPQINHINGIKTDNRVENLEWVNCSENLLHAYKVLNKKSSLSGKFGKDNHLSKKILQIKDGKIIATFWGYYEAQRKTGVLAQNINACCKGRIKQAGGYKWEQKAT